MGSMLAINEKFGVPNDRKFAGSKLAQSVKCNSATLLLPFLYANDNPGSPFLKKNPAEGILLIVIWPNLMIGYQKSPP